MPMDESPLASETSPAWASCISPDAVGTAEGSLISVLAYVGGVATAGVIAVASSRATAGKGSAIEPKGSGRPGAPGVLL